MVEVEVVVSAVGLKVEATPPEDIKRHVAAVVSYISH
jgi:hypothetical protein